MKRSSICSRGKVWDGEDGELGGAVLRMPRDSFGWHIIDGCRSEWERRQRDELRRQQQCLVEQSIRLKEMRVGGETKRQASCRANITISCKETKERQNRREIAQAVLNSTTWWNV